MKDKFLHQPKCTEYAPASLNIKIPQFRIKITKIPHEKLTNTAIPQTPISPYMYTVTILDD